MRKTFLKLFLALGCVALTNALASTTTFLGPTAKGVYTGALDNVTDYTVIGELGVKNARLNGTMAWLLPYNYRIKLTADLLSQRLTYHFFTGDTTQWLNQGAVGFNYQSNMSYSWIGCTQFNFNAYAAYAPNKNLQSLIDPAFTDARRIASSTAYGISPGIMVEPIPGTRAGFDINYDNVNYANTISPHQTAIGLGATLHLDQRVTRNIWIGLLASVRQPYNNYHANVTWNNIPYVRNLSVGVFADYTKGKRTLPNSYNIGLSASYALDCQCNSFTRYASDPAIYMPQVLAVPDESVTIP